MVLTMLWHEHGLWSDVLGISDGWAGIDGFELDIGIALVIGLGWIGLDWIGLDWNFGSALELDRIMDWCWTCFALWIGVGIGTLDGLTSALPVYTTIDRFNNVVFISSLLLCSLVRSVLAVLAEVTTYLRSSLCSREQRWVKVETGERVRWSLLCV